MRRFLSSYGTALLLLVGVACMYAPVAYAQALTQTAVPAYTPPTAAPLVNAGSSVPTVGDYIGAAQTGVPIAPPTDPAAASTPLSFVGAGIDSILGSIMNLIMGIFAWLLGVAMVTLDYTVYYTVVKMGDYVHNLSAIGVAWRILRDVGNIALIFGFLAIGITTILNTEWYGGGKKMLPMLLVAAVFLNFSLFMSEAVIDTGNLFATQFYTQINGGVPAGQKLSAGSNASSFSGVASVGSSIANEAISQKIMSVLGLQTIYGAALNSNTQVFKEGNITFISMMGILLFIVAAFVMFSIAFILIARFIALILLIILSPLGFAGLAIPQLASSAGLWWRTLFDQTITAPVLLLLLYIALRVITDVNFLSFGASGPDYLGFISSVNGGFNLPGLASAVLSFSVAMGLLLSVTYFSKKLGAMGSGWAMNSAGKLTGALSFGAASFAGRSTFGMGGYLLNNKRMQARASRGGVGGTFAKAASFTGRNLESRTFDFRNAPGVRAAGMAIGSINNNGFGSVVAGQTKITAKTGMDATREGFKYVKGDWWRDQQKEYEKVAAERDRKKIATDPNSRDFTKTIRKMSEDELVELKGIRKGLDTYVAALSPAAYNTLSKSDKLLKGEKDKIKTAWSNQFDAAISGPNNQTGAEKVKANIGKLNAGEIGSLDGDILTRPDVMSTLGPKELEAIRSKNVLTEEQRHTIYAYFYKHPQAAPQFNTYLAQDTSGRRMGYWNI